MHWKNSVGISHFVMEPETSGKRMYVADDRSDARVNKSVNVMYNRFEITSFPLESRTRTHFLLAEFGFLGFLIRVFKTTPFKWGAKPTGVSFIGL